MATPVKQSSLFIPLVSQEKKSKTLLFTIPQADSWFRSTNVIDFYNSHFMQWREVGKKLKDSDHRITYTHQIIHNINFIEFCRKKSNEINLISHDKFIFLEPFVENRFLIKWIKKGDLQLTYLFTLLVGFHPDFFRLEYETKNEKKYNSESDIYLEMLENAKMADYHSSQT